MGCFGVAAVSVGRTGRGKGAGTQLRSEVCIIRGAAGSVQSGLAIAPELGALAAPPVAIIMIASRDAFDAGGPVAGPAQKRSADF